MQNAAQISWNITICLYKKENLKGLLNIYILPVTSSLYIAS